MAVDTFSSNINKDIKKKKKKKNLSLAGFELGTLDCECSALPTWPLQHTEVSSNI